MLDDGIQFSVSDFTYTLDWKTLDEEQEASAALKAELEADYDVQAQPSSVGFGAASAAFLIKIDWNILWGISPFAAFFAGKKIVENVKAFYEIYIFLRERVFKRKAVLDRCAAVSIAVHAIGELTGTVMSSVQLLGYGRSSWIDCVEGNQDSGRVTTIEPPEERLKDWVHTFRIKTSEKIYRVLVSGSTVIKIIEEDDMKDLERLKTE